MDSQRTIESNLESQSPSSAASTLSESNSAEMKSENASVPETQVSNQETVENKERDEPTEVTWDCDNDPQNPRNWPKWRKW